MTEPGSADGQARTTVAVIEDFNAAFNSRDVDAIMALMTDDVIFENTGPAPNGERHVGQPAVRECWERLFAAAPETSFTTEDVFAAGDRCLVRWVYQWGGAGATPGHVRGVDIFRVRDGKVAEKLAYVKG